ncbi:CocE/NonD family hydrolase [Paucibacter sp. APW11]|uniref:CocE/NonD family hydrolase n=1 Tax=Roseateles aquae TaxID=3077235 RepID=A0ABU3PF23_9BURK|nr:CocE/NonD family hydrolase [Paucibacter sp. APW11]MDT9000511.1 CocE/NonD family hydrolase [Paucibacter sp. APW11]
MAALFSAAARSAPEPYDLKANYTKYEYRIAMRDGKRLFTVVYQPKDASKRYPLLMTRTPYSCGPYGEDHYGGWGLVPSEEFYKAGYIVVCQDVRGRNMSEGTFTEMTPHVAQKKSKNDVDESSDMHDSVQWLIDHLPNHNGRVGIWGNSYPGFYSAASIIDSHPAIKAASPQAPIADYYRGDDGYHGGAFMLAHNYGFFTSFKPQENPTSAPQRWGSFSYNSGDAYEYFLKLGNLSSIAKTLGTPGNPYFNDLIEHDSYDAHWKPRSIAPHLNNVRAAVLTVGGWFDAEDLPGPLAIYRSIEARNPGISNQIVMGPWRHGGWFRTAGKSIGMVDFGQKSSEYFMKQILLPFFEQHLRGGSDAKLAEATMFETGSNVWRQYPSWPPAEAKPRKLYLQAGGKLGWQAPTEGAGAGIDSYVSDPAKPVPFIGYAALGMPAEYMVSDQRFASTRPDVLVYQSEVLESDLTVAGPVKARLYVSTTGTDSDFIVKLIDVYPHNRAEEEKGAAPPPDVPPPQLTLNGYQQLVRGEPLRARFRKGLDKPEAVTPGEVMALDIELPDVNHNFRRGHKLMVQVQSSWFPLLDRNPQRFVRIRDARPEDFQPATQQLFHTAAQASALELRVIDAPQ